MRSHRLVLLAAAVVLVGAIAATSAVAGATQQSATVNWHGQQTMFIPMTTNLYPGATGNSGAVAGASATIVRNANGISYRLSTTGLTPGNAYTLWLVTVNNPGACTANKDPAPPNGCTAPELINDGDVDAQVRYAAGHVAGASGAGTFSGHVKTGPLTGWLPGRSLGDPMAAEVHLVVNDHGPELPAFMPSMIKTYRGGCADRPTSPFPGPFPASALADGDNAGPGGTDGPNTCLLFQSAVFTTP